MFATPAKQRITDRPRRNEICLNKAESVEINIAN